MDKQILTFCNQYKEYLKNPDGGVSFKLIYREALNFMPFDIRSIKLDGEDLKYLYDKYSKQLHSEMEENIKNVKELYEDKD